MSDNAVNQDVKQETAMDSDKNPTVVQDEKQNMIPQARFNEVNAQYKEVSQKLANYEAEKEEARKKQLQEQGKHEELIGEQKKELERLQTFETDVMAQRKAEKADLLSQLPEDQQGIYSELSTPALRKHIANQVNVNPQQTKAGKPKRICNEPNGGYSNSNEWAQKDPKGFEQYLRDEHGLL